MEPFNPKKENVPYTIAIIKPDIVAEDEKVNLFTPSPHSKALNQIY